MINKGEKGKGEEDHFYLLSLLCVLIERDTVQPRSKSSRTLAGTVTSFYTRFLMALRVTVLVGVRELLEQDCTVVRVSVLWVAAGVGRSACGRIDLIAEIVPCWCDNREVQYRTGTTARRGSFGA